MIWINKYSRLLTIALCLLYIFTGSGLDKITYQCASMIHSKIVFPCKGKGCQCDKAGYELPNCQCDHDKGTSCCSVEEVPEESCCSEDTIAESLEYISNVPCQGIEEPLTLSLGKHIVLLPAVVKPKKLVFPNHKTPYKFSLEEAEKLPNDKIPIFS